MEAQTEPLYELPVGTIFYRIYDRDNPSKNNDRYFLEHHKAVVFELLTNPDLLPIPAKEVDLERYGRTMLNRPGLQYRFPDAHRYRLVAYRTTYPVGFYNRNLDDQELERGRDSGRFFAGYHIEKAETRLLKGNYNYLQEKRSADGTIVQELDGPRAFRALVAVSRVGQSEVIEARSFRMFNRGGLLFPFAIFPIGWDSVWRLFLTVHIQDPSLENVVDFFRAIMTDQEQQMAVIKGRVSPGYDDCHEGVIGFVNQGTSCFMDSTLICMFAFKNSPFVDNLLTKGLLPRGQFTTCNEDPARDEELRRLVYENLQVDYQQIISGRQIMCSNLRQILGRECNISGDPQSDFSFQMGPPDEMYQRLMTVLNYMPIQYNESIIRAASAEGEDERLSIVQVQDATMLPRLRVDDPELTKVSWPSSWNTEYENVNSGDRMTFRRSEFQIVKADVIVVHVDRSIFGPVAVAPSPFLIPSSGGLLLPPPVLLPTPAVSSGANALSALFGNLDQAVVPTPISTGPQLTIPPTQTSGLPMPSSTLPRPTEPSLYRNETAVNPKKLEIDQTFIVGEQPFDLRAAVYSPNDGHYAALLRCGASWFNYDDLLTGQPISNNVMPLQQVQTLLETRAVLLFYYPPFKPWTQLEKEMVADLTAQLANIRPN